VIAKPPEPPVQARDWRVSAPLELTPILSAALDAFYESGYHGTSVRDIARRVGVTVPALYYHHENKEAILFALLERSIDHLRALCDLAVEDAEDDVVERFLNLVECLVRYTSRSSKMAHLDAEIRSLSPNLRGVYAGKRHEIEAMVLGTTEAGVSGGQFDVPFPRDTVRALMGMIQAIATWFNPGGPLTVDEVADRYKAISARMIGASPDLVERYRTIASSAPRATPAGRPSPARRRR
jgi:AcrR family transcriptional regulator